jgi:hypothetical protein
VLRRNTAKADRNASLRAITNVAHYFAVMT